MKTVTKHIQRNDVGSNGETVSRGKYTVCPVCYNVKYKKQWYAPDSKIAFLAGGQKARVGVERCPACEMKLRGTYKAEVILHDVPRNLRYMIESLILNEAQQVSAYNPQHRLLEIVETLDGYEVRTSTPKLVRAISEKLLATFKASEVVWPAFRSAANRHTIDVNLKILSYV